MSPNNTATNPGPTGPRTIEGKAISSQNALKYGLFTRRDFVLPDERDEYNETWLLLLDRLCPDGILEQTFADEIMSAQWRLRRCRIAESDLATRSLEDETLDEAALDRKQLSIDRARASAHRLMCRSIAELRKLQTERKIRLEFGDDENIGLADTAQNLRATRMAVEPEPQAEPEPPRKRITLADLENLMALADQKLCADIRSENPSSFCTPNTSASSQPAPASRPGRQSALQALRDARNRAA